MALAWIAVALAFAVAEVATVALFAAFVSLGALAAAVIAFAGGGLVAQGTVFAAIALLGVVVVRPPLMRHLQSRHAPAMMSGALAMIGQTGVVVDPIRGPHERGHVRIAGENWPALTTDGKPVDAGATVRIVDIEKTTLVVVPKS